MPKKITFNDSCFRAYDIRGKVNTDFDSAGVHAFGQVLRDFICEKTGKTNSHIVIGFDGRTTSPSIEQSMIDGLYNDSQTNDSIMLTRIGCGPTPMMYFASLELKADAAIMITASHNPSTYNGFKILINQTPLTSTEIQLLKNRLKKRIEQNERQLSFEQNRTSQLIHDDSIQNKYVQHLVKSSGKIPFRIAWDPGNGSAGEVLQDLLSQIDGEHYTINQDIDGSFPAHAPDPTQPQNLEQLGDLVTDLGCDFGIALDGDGDRFAVVDSYGEMVPMSVVMTMLATDILEKHPGSTIISDVKMSPYFFKTIDCLGGKSIMAPTGYTFLKEHMQSHNAIFGGEASGHVCFKDSHPGYDDGLYAALRFIKCLTEMMGNQDQNQDQSQDQTLSRWIDHHPKIYTSYPIKIPVLPGINSGNQTKFDIVRNIQRILNDNGTAFCNIDGIRVELKSGWWCLRASNTEDHISILAEAPIEQDLDQILIEIEHLLKQAGLKDTP